MGGFKGHGEELEKQTHGKEQKAFLRMVLPRGCYMEIGQNPMGVEGVGRKSVRIKRLIKSAAQGTVCLWICTTA